MAERRLISSPLSDADADRFETLDTVAGGAKALPGELAVNKEAATEIRARGDIVSKLFSAAAAAVFVSRDYGEERDDVLLTSLASMNH
jgi:hypothetical protein